MLSLSIFLKTLTPEEVEFTNQLGEFFYRLTLVIKNAINSAIEWLTVTPLYDLAYYGVILLLMSPIFISFITQCKFFIILFKLIKFTLKFIKSLLKFTVKLVKCVFFGTATFIGLVSILKRK